MDETGQGLGPPSRHQEAFLEMMAAERGASANTIAAYRRDLDDFAAFTRREGRSTDEAGPDLIRRYLAALADQGLSARTSARRLSALRQYFRFLYAEGARRDDPTSVIDGPKPARRLPKVLSEAQVEALLSQARQRPGPRGARLIAMMELLYATGL